MAQQSLIPLHFDDQAIRGTTIENEPWFVASDVCEALNIQNPTQATARLDDDERSMLNIGQKGEVIVLSEAGVYTLALRCRDAMKPGTAPYRFRKWVTGVALPALRRGHDPHAVTELSPEVRGAIGGIVKGVVAKAVQELLPAMVQAEISSHRYAIVEGVSALEAAEIVGYGVGKRPRGLTQFISRRLTRFHEDRGVPVRRSRHGSGKVKLFDEAATRRWVAAGGKAETDAYVSERLGQGKLRLIG